MNKSINLKGLVVAGLKTVCHKTE